MAESQNVQISMTLFKKIMRFFDLLSISKPDLPKFFEFGGIHEELSGKQHSINLRTAYTKILRAKDDEHRIAAKEDYLNLKEGGKRARCAKNSL